ncbi:MAG: outer membrane protein transport protein [Deltaproteobacteria bacterium]|nr:outer membrane protein transport protein [Deltaproteobacteria bacterium]
MASRANASGFFVTERGVRPLARGGAFVAGADDAHSMWFNPAGLVHAGRSFLIDAAYVGHNVRYTRESLPAMNMPVSYPTVTNGQAPLAIPTLALTHNFGLQRANFGLMIAAPNAVIPSYPEGSQDNPAPQRYSLYTLNGSILATVGVYGAYKPSEQFSFGGGILMLAGTFNARVALTGCPSTITCQPEDPAWDAVAQIEAGPILSPTAAMGVQFAPAPWLRLGLSGQLPMWVDAPAKLRVRLPSHPFYDGAMTQGDSASVSFVMAPILRAGVEVRPTPVDRIEVAFVWEAWSVHDAITLTPQGMGISLTNVRGVGTYQIGPQTIVRGWQHAFSARIGYERHQSLPGGWKLFPRAGFSFDSSASPNEYTSVMTLDADKFVGTAGVGFGRGAWRIDANFAYAYSPPVVVAAGDARIPVVAPFRQSRDANRNYINGGRYEMSNFVAGAGFEYRF